MSRPRSGVAQAAAPYRRIPVRRLLFECNRRLSSVRGPRAFELVAALVYRWPQVQSGIVYIGDAKMGDLMHRCGRTAHRAKYDLLRVGLIRLHHAGPRMCSCRRCGGVGAGGRILNSRGQPVSCATGYELDPEVLGPPVKTPRGGNGRPSSSSSRYVSPAQARVRAEGQAQLREALDRMRSRAGP
jgi:hypothetical protein